jgi:hypothetical protein
VKENKIKGGDNKTSTHIIPFFNRNNSQRHSHDSIISLQRTIGNQAVLRLMRSNSQFDFPKSDSKPKLKINRPGDMYEREAETVAEQRTKMPPPGAVSSQDRERNVDSKCSAYDMNKEEMGEGEKMTTIQRKASGDINLEASDEITNEINNLRLIGAPLLDANTKEIMMSNFGYDFNKIRIHADQRAARSAKSLDALAYTVGNDIVFAEGHYKPNTIEGRKLLTHELTHVLQQSKLGEASPVIRRKLNTLGGEWDTDKYTAKPLGGKNIGVDIDLKFMPKSPTNATKIGLLQMVNSIQNGAPFVLGASPTIRSRSIPSGDPNAGAHIDRRVTNPNPVYAANSSASTLAGTTVSSNADLGWHYNDSTGRLKKKDAHLRDTPDLPTAGNNSSQIFESTALALEGTQEGTTYGSVEWGWKRDDTGAFSRLPLKVTTMGIPTETFRRSAQLWNTSRTEATPSTPSVAVIQLPGMRALQPTPGTEAKEVESALKVNDFATAYQILNGQWIKPMLPTLSALSKKKHLQSLYSNLGKAIGIDTPRLRTAIECVQYKENKTPLSQEFYDWIDPVKNNRIGEINEIKAFIGMR